MNIDRDKYFKILKSQGLHAALTELHREYGGLEFESFEGEKGYQPQMWRGLDELRAFSRELWDSAASEDAKGQIKH
jgi:hypothetical protein